MNDTEILHTLTTHRRFLHTIPEMGNAEWKTSAYLQAQLAETSPDSLEVLCGTGIKCVYLCGRENAETLAFRSDIDALPIPEKSDCPVQSSFPGKMHACGHDGHMAVLLTFARILGQKKQQGCLQHNVVLLFQPAEETASGAAAMLESRVLCDPPVSAVFGMHLMPSVAKGSIALSPGGVMASNSFLRIRFSGKASHGATPHLGQDAGAAMASAYLLLQSYMTHTVPAADMAVLTFGKMTAGTQRNIVADEAIMEGMLRTYDMALQKQLLSGILEVCQSASAVYGVKVCIETESNCPVVCNDECLYAKYAGCVPCRTEQTPVLIAEDFALYGEKVPALFAFVGVGDEQHASPLHSDTFNFDEAALLPAVHYYTNIIEKN